MLRSQPLVPVALLLMAGIVAARSLAPAPLALIGVLLAGTLLRRKLRLTGAALLLLALGAALYWHRYAVLSEHDLRIYCSGEPMIVAVRGVLSETPQIRDYNSNEVSSARLQVSAIKMRSEWQPAKGEILTRTRGSLPDSYFESREVEVSGVLASPPPASAPGLFDFRAYLHSHRIFFQLNTESAAEWTLLREQVAPFAEKLRRWAKDRIARGLPEDDQVRMLWAMTLGWRTAMSGEMAEPFMRTGTMHVIAISGLHVTCIAGMMLLLARAAGIPRFKAAFIAVPAVWAYTLLTGWQSSGIRSALMCTALICGWLLKRPTLMLNSLAAAAIAILVFQPEQLFQAPFTLSFSVVTSIALLTPVLESVFCLHWLRDTFLPRALWETPKYRFYARHLSPSLSISSASFLGALPLTAVYYNMFTPVSLLANLVAVPFSSIALTSSMLSLLPLPGPPVFQWVSWFFTKLTIKSATLFECLGGYYYVSPPSLGFCVFYLTLLAALFSPALWHNNTRWWVLSIVVAVMGGWLFLRDTRPVIHVLSAAGSPVWADLKGKANDLLVDCSDERGFNFVLKRFLRAQGIGTLPNVALTHGDIDHLGGFPELLKQFTPRAVVTSFHASRSRAHKAALAALEHLPSWQRVSRGEKIGEWKVLHPAERKFPRAEDNAIVLRTTVEGWRVLVASDLGREGQADLLRSGESIEADIALLGVPERGESYSEEFLKRISARVIVLGAAGLHSRKDRLLEMIARSHAALLEVSEAGSTTLRFSRRECAISSMTGKTLTLAR